MYYHYYLNLKPQTTGEHEVHREGCAYMPSVLNREYLGYFTNAKLAIAKAKAKYPGSVIDGCKFCSSEAHTR